MAAPVPVTAAPVAAPAQVTWATEVVDPVPTPAPVPPPPVEPPRVDLLEGVRTPPPARVPPPPAPVPVTPEPPVVVAGAWSTSGVPAAPAPPGAPPSDPRGRQRAGLVIAAVALLLAVVVASAVLWRSGLLGGPDEGGESVVAPARPSSAPAPSSPASPSDEASPAASPDSPSSEPSPLATTGESLTGSAVASAPVTSQDAFDGSGNTTTYRASNMLDGDLETTWRMNGDGTGKSLTFALDGPATVSRVGLVNGYAKIDPATGEDRYAQSRRITAVTWTVGGETFRQDLADGDTGMQLLDVGPVQGRRVSVRIDATTGPGDASFDQTAISEVEITG